ncbi:MAG: DNA translocase FtsK [Clostridia bacterium]|nr:DNA translocase FtsK [Clostridia bacterium]
MPLFIGFICIVAAIGRDSRKYKFKVFECFVLFTLLVSFLHIVNTVDGRTYGEQLTDAYNVFKNYNGTGMHFGYGVFGALFGGLPLLLTGGSRLAAGIIVILLFIVLFMLFSGTTLLKLLQSLRAPAEAVSDYAEEKINDIKETYTSTNEERQERRAKSAERRRKERVEKHEIDLDIPIDDVDVVIPDNGVDPIIADEDVFDRNVEIADIVELFKEDAEDSAAEAEVYPSLEDMKKENQAPSEVVFDDIISAYEEEYQQDNSINVENDVSENDDETIEENNEDFSSEESVDLIEAVPEEIPYELPSVDLLDLPKNNGSTGSAYELREKGETIVKTLKSFGVGTKIVEICQSPSVTRFELQPEPGVKISRITALADDIAMNLAASGVRIEAPIPNKNAVGIEVPNAEKAMVTLREILDNGSFKNSKSKINVALGRDIQGAATCADLAKMPHLLVAGTTGSGKSVCLNTMIMSLLYNATPDEVKLIMIDPKKVEFTVYKSIPHLLVPVVADPRKAAGALSWAVAEMDKRYALFADNGVRNLQGYNTFALSHGLPKMPQIVIIIDELSDLMMAASNEVEDSICRLAQKARAAGMHLIVATQRPSVDVITGLIKANIPSRIAFAVKSQIDSRTIIDTQGAEKLLGNGDMLYCPVGLSKPVRVQGCYVSDDEIERVIEFVTAQGSVKYDDAVMQEIELKAAQDGKKKNGGSSGADTPTENNYDDEMFPKAIEVVVEAGMASTTLLQRKLKLGYARAARIVDELSEKGIIGPYEGCKPRKVLITKEQWYEMQANSSAAPKQLSVDDIAVNNTDNSSVSGNSDSLSGNHNYFGSAVDTSED